jgi:hypothetical protein
MFVTLVVPRGKKKTQVKKAQRQEQSGKPFAHGLVLGPAAPDAVPWEQLLSFPA